MTLLPHAAALFAEPRDAKYLGLLENPADTAVYFSWIRQAADGSFFHRNLFTADPQLGRSINLFALLLGWAARGTGAPVPLVYHAFRVLCIVVVGLLLYRFAAYFLPAPRDRRLAFGLGLTGAGWGWLPFWADAWRPVDMVQPEAILFQALAGFGLMAFALALMLGTVVLLLRAQESGRLRDAVGAGLCGLALGNSHSYDVIPLFLAWAGYLALLAWRRELRRGDLVQSLVAAAVAAPAVFYQAWIYRADPVFRQRADVATLAGPLPTYLLAYGIPLLLAVGGAVLFWRAGPAAPRWKLLPVVWAPLHLASVYLPFAFQRKLIMGAQLPIAVLAAAGWSSLVAARLAGRADWTRSPAARFGTAALLLLSAVTNGVQLAGRCDVALANRIGTFYPVAWDRDTLAAVEWAHRSTAPESTWLASPSTAILLPAFAGRAVWAGHWGETPRMQQRFEILVAFYAGTMRPERRATFLSSERIDYVLYGPFEQLLAAGRWQPGPLLKPVFQAGRAVVYRVERR